MVAINPSMQMYNAQTIEPGWRGQGAYTDEKSPLYFANSGVNEDFFSYENQSVQENKSDGIGFGTIATLGAIGVTALAFIKGRKVDGNVLQKIGAGFKSMGQGISNFFKKGTKVQANYQTVSGASTATTGVGSTIPNVAKSGVKTTKVMTDVTLDAAKKYTNKEFSELAQKAAQDKSLYRKLMKVFHPDFGGDHEVFVRFQDAYTKAKAVNMAA